MTPAKSNSKVIVLEGLPGTGKTSIISTLRKEINVVDGIVLKSENITNGGEIFFLENDREKIKQGKMSDGLTLIDRGYPSTLAHNYSRLFFDQKRDYFQLLETFVKYKKLQKNIPDVYIHIEIDVETSIMRKKRKANPNDIWTIEKYLKVIKNYYEFHFRFLEPDIKIIKINGLLPLPNIINEIRNYLKI